MSHAHMQRMSYSAQGLSHLWAHGKFEKALKIWKRNAEIRAELAA